MDEKWRKWNERWKEKSEITTTWQVIMMRRYQIHQSILENALNCRQSIFKLFALTIWTKKKSKDIDDDFEYGSIRGFGTNRPINEKLQTKEMAAQWWQQNKTNKITKQIICMGNWIWCKLLRHGAIGNEAEKYTNRARESEKQSEKEQLNER